jgi:pimeloyl-ACP methyl ester carboxylesterase
MVAQANTVPLNVVQLGSTGSPLIMLHGWGQSINSLWILGELLSAYRKVHLIDLPGFGKSPKPPEDWSTLEYAQCILKYMDDNGLAQADLLGHSFGGRICLRLASNYPQRVSKLILVDSHGLKSQRSVKAHFYGFAISRMGRLLKLIDKLFSTHSFEHWFAPKFGSRDYKDAGSMRNILVKTVNEDQADAVQSIVAPTLILNGEKDTETPVEMAQRLHKYIRNSQLIILPGKDHFPFIGEGAHLCASYIRKFLMSEDNSIGGTTDVYASH